MPSGPKARPPPAWLRESTLRKSWMYWPVAGLISEDGVEMLLALSMVPLPLTLARLWPAPPTSTTSLPGTTPRPSASRVKRER